MYSNVTPAARLGSIITVCPVGLPKPVCPEISENCGELTFHSPAPTPLLPAPALSAGESRVSEGESTVKSTGGPCLALVARSPKWPPSLFWGGLSRDSLSCRHGEASSFLFKVHGPWRLPAR